MYLSKEVLLLILIHRPKGINKYINQKDKLVPVGARDKRIRDGVEIEKLYEIFKNIKN